MHGWGQQPYPNGINEYRYIHTDAPHMLAFKRRNKRRRQEPKRPNQQKDQYTTNGKDFQHTIKSRFIHNPFKLVFNYIAFWAVKVNIIVKLFAQTLAQFKKNNVLCNAKETNVLVR